MIRIKLSAWITFSGLWALGSVVAARTLSLDLPAALLGGLAAAVLHWAALSAHHLGHALAARTAGYPMVGVLLWWGLATSLYPRDEPELPTRIHIRRALGGPIASVAFGGLCGALAWALRARGDMLWLLPGFAAVDSLVLFGIGSLFPLGFNDGSTLLRWSTRRRAGHS